MGLFQEAAVTLVIVINFPWELVCGHHLTLVKGEVYTPTTAFSNASSNSQSRKNVVWSTSPCKYHLSPEHTALGFFMLPITLVYESGNIVWSVRFGCLLLKASHCSWLTCIAFWFTTSWSCSGTYFCVQWNPTDAEAATNVSYSSLSSSFKYFSKLNHLCQVIIGLSHGDVNGLAHHVRYVYKSHPRFHIQQNGSANATYTPTSMVYICNEFVTLMVARNNQMTHLGRFTPLSSLQTLLLPHYRHLDPQHYKIMV